MTRLLCVLCIVCLLLSGCLEKRNIENLGIITAAGYDLLDDGWLEGTHVLFQFDPNATNISQILVSRAKTSKGLMHDASLKTSKKLVSGHQRLSLFGRDLSEKGLMRLMDTMARDANAADMMYIALGENTSKSILKASNFEDAPNMGSYLYKLIEKNVKEEKIPPCTLHDFLHDFYSYGTDPILPIITIEENKPTIRKLGLLKRDQVVGSISAKEGFYIKLLRDRYTSASIEIVVPKEPFKDDILTNRHYKELQGMYLNLDEVSSNSSIKVIDKENLKFKATIDFDTRLLEVSEDIDVSQKETLKKLEKYISKNIEMQIIELIEKLKESNSDPIGLGSIYAKFVGHENLKDDKWHELFPNVEVDVEVNTRIIRFGITN